jgi:hypothetical protein
VTDADVQKLLDFADAMNFPVTANRLRELAARMWMEASY